MRLPQTWVVAVSRTPRGPVAKTGKGWGKPSKKGRKGGKKSHSGGQKGRKGGKEEGPTRLRAEEEGQTTAFWRELRLGSKTPARSW